MNSIFIHQSTPENIVVLRVEHDEIDFKLKEYAKRKLLLKDQL